ncbi:MAG TPA: heme o synthase [Vicinamibacteria bacterium]|nr:heme o synthase [Vicinamibacteria bacterium]
MSLSAVVPLRAGPRDYLELTKPRITLMVVLTALLGFVMASPVHAPLGPLVAALLGTGLVAAGASALNMLLEAETDALMARTRMRPLPAGRLRPREVLVFGVGITVAGLLVLGSFSGLLAAALALLTWASYLFWYTPLKTRTSLATLVGAFPGALPPVIGWVAARGTLDPGALILFAILFLWQIPHFLAIASIYREDYARGGLPMLPVLDPLGGLTGRQTVLHSLCLLAASLMPFVAGMAGRSYLVVATVLGIAFTAIACWSAVTRTPLAARRLFLGSVLYLAALSTLLLLDRR